MSLYVQRDGTSWPRTVAAMIDPSADRAVFRQLADLLRGQIESGDLGPGEPLPSELRLAQEYGISRTTVRQAIGQLRTEGLVTVERPRGTFVRVPEPTQVVALARGELAGARMPTDAERRAYRLGEGVPVLVVTAPDGQVTVHPADRVQLTRP
jgi:DNA-binding transcriptional regulator YhcF (GntR family)